MKALQKLRQNLEMWEHKAGSAESAEQVFLHSQLLKMLEHQLMQDEHLLTILGYFKLTENVSELNIQKVYEAMHESMREAADFIKEEGDTAYESTIQRGGRTIFDGRLGREDFNQYFQYDSGCGPSWTDPDCDPR